MSAAIGIMVRVSVRMRVRDGCAANRMRVRKQSNTRVVTYKKRHENER